MSQCRSGSTPKRIRWKAMSRPDAHSIYRMAREYDRITKKGNRCHGGEVGPMALKVLEVLTFDFLNYSTGRLDPSYEAIAKKANISVSAVAAALRRLWDLGFLDWVRRCDESWVNGRYVREQRTNAYRLRPVSEWRTAWRPDKAPLPHASTWGKPEYMPNILDAAVIELRSSADRRGVLRALKTGEPSSLASALALLGQHFLPVFPDSTAS